MEALGALYDLVDGMVFLLTWLRGLAVVLVLPFLLILVSHAPGEVLRAFGDAFARDRESLPLPRLMD